MGLLEKKPVDHPLEDLRLAHAPPAQKDRGRGAAGDGLQRVFVEVFQVFRPVSVDLLRGDGTDGPRRHVSVGAGMARGVYFGADSLSVNGGRPASAHMAFRRVRVAALASSHIILNKFTFLQ